MSDAENCCSEATPHFDISRISHDCYGARLHSDCLHQHVCLHVELGDRAALERLWNVLDAAGSLDAGDDSEMVTVGQLMKVAVHPSGCVLWLGTGTAQMMCVIDPEQVVFTAAQIAKHLSASTAGPAD